MGNFLKAASKHVGDVRTFLREAAGGNSIKYSAEKGAKHTLYIPYTSSVVIDEATGAQKATKELCAMSAKVHEWTTSDGKFKACACLDGVVIQGENGELVNDGECPFCNRISSAWEIANYRKEAEEVNCKLTGDNRKTHLETMARQINDEMKVKKARDYMYMLVVKYRYNEQGQPVIGADGLPEYELKLMRMSPSRVESIQKQLANSGSDLPGSELIIEYPSVDDRRLLVSQSTTSPVFPDNRLVTKYPELANKINNDIAKFDWDSIDKIFPELAGMPSVQAKATVNAMFEQWDNYKKELVTNPSAKYLEYVVETPTAMPSLGGAETPIVPVIPGGVVAPTVPNAGTPTVPIMGAPTIPIVPGASTAGAPTGAPTVPITPVAGAGPVVGDPNAVFAGANGATPTVTM